MQHESAKMDKSSIKAYAGSIDLVAQRMLSLVQSNTHRDAQQKGNQAVLQ